MHRILSLTLALLAASPAAALAQDPAPDPVPLTQGWEFAPDPGDDGLAAGRAGGGGDGWTPVGVPHAFDRRPRDERFRGTVGWYRLTFEGPALPEEMRWALRFDGVRRVTTAWLNGERIGTNRDPYNAFELPATGLRQGEPNTLVLRVDNRKGREPREGWWNWGGIVRPVKLVPRGRAVLRDVGLLPHRECRGDACQWYVRIDGDVTGHSAAALEPVSVDVRLRSPAGDVSERSVALRALREGDLAHVAAEMPVTGDPATWSPESPRLYDAEVTVRAAGRVEQVERLRIGLREVDVAGGMLRLNGRVLDLRGASIQEDLPGRGAALSDEDIERIVRDLKAVGANVTRAHYVLDERLLRRLDEEGILVWSQAPVYHRDVSLTTQAGRSYELGVLRRTVLAGRNHPSVITHSVANELSPTPDAVPATRRWLEAAARLTKQLDPTLPVALDLLSYPGHPPQRTYRRFDALGINSYFGWYRGKPAPHSTANLEDLGPFLVQTRRRYPRQALVMTEFGAEATFDGPRTVKETYAFQTEYVRRNLRIVDGLPFMGGAIYWTLREFAVKPRWDGGAERRGIPRDAIHNKGLLTYDGRPKPAWQVARSEFRSQRLYRDTETPRERLEAGAAPGERFVAGGLLAAILLVLVFDAVCLREILRGRRRVRAQSGAVVPLRRDVPERARALRA